MILWHYYVALNAFISGVFSFLSKAIFNQFDSVIIKSVNLSVNIMHPIKLNTIPQNDFTRACTDRNKYLKACFGNTSPIRLFSLK